MSVDLSDTIIPKSDQLNADDLIAGPRTVKIISVARASTPEQPISITHDGGKPYFPCKSMRRVLVQVWGKDGLAYIGRSMTLFRDPDAMFGGMKVGGIRISHMSHLERDMTMALTASKAQRKPFTVKPLKVAEAKPAPASDKAADIAKAIAERISETRGKVELDEILADETIAKQRDWLKAKRPELAEKVDTAISYARSNIETDDGPDGDLGVPETTSATTQEMEAA